MNRLEVYQGNDGKYYCRLVASNNTIVCWTEGYNSHENALKAAMWIKKNAGFAIIMEK
ncbi:MAG: DUF1508 domain-containing protein [Parcubacteria group bacterium]